MCEAISASTMLYLTLASTAAAGIYGYTEQQKAADQQTKAIENGYAQQAQQLLDRYQQLNANASDQEGERAREARIELARLRAIGAESGLGGGNSQDRIEHESQFLAGSDMATVEANRANALRQAQFEGQASQREAAARLSAVRHPSLIGTGLQIAGDGLSHVNAYKACFPKGPRVGNSGENF